MAEDVMVRFSDDKLATQFLTKEEIQKVCPLAYAEAPTNKVSDKYVLANTGTVIEDMEKLGWKVVSAKQRKAKTGKQSRFSFHMITFQNPDVKILGQDQDGNDTIEGYPRVICTSSHDGFSCFQFLIGCFRLVCSNHLIIATKKFTNLKIRHINYTFEDLRKLIAEILENLPKQISLMNEMQKRVLTKDQQHKLALSMFKVRLGKSEDDILEVDEETLDTLLDPVRDEDKADNLWNTYNILQEKFVRGLFNYKKDGGKVRKARAIKGFVSDMQFNERAWKLAESYLEI